MKTGKPKPNKNRLSGTPQSKDDYIGWGGAAVVNLVPFGGLIYGAVQHDKYPLAAKSAVRVEAFKWVLLGGALLLATGVAGVAAATNR